MVMLASAGLLVVVIETTSSSGRTANMLEARVSAESLAEAGLAQAFSILNFEGNNPTEPTLLGCNSGGTSCTPVSLTEADGDEGSGSFYGVLDLLASEWTVTSTGQVPNPTGSVPATVTLNATVPLVITNGDPNAAAWNYLFSTRPPGSGCEVNVGGSNVVIDIPMYVRGDLCLSGSNAMIDERGEGQSPAPAPIDLRVGGKLVISGSNATAGVPLDYLTSAGIALGCASTVTGTPHTCTTADKYYVTTSGTFNEIDFPEHDMAGWFAHTDTINSTALSGGDCNVRAGTPPNINPDALLDGDAGTINLTPGSSYTCRKVVNGVTVAELSWNGSTTLTVKGVIVVDGNMNSTDTLATYAGSATIYLNGSFSLTSSDAKLCATPSCTFTSWDPNTEMLAIIANTSIALNGSNNTYQGALMCPPTASANVGGSNTVVHGPIICGTFDFTNASNVEFKPMPPIGQVPLGAPTDYDVSVEPGTPSYGG
ncbi:MAG: hypothetical protein ACXW0R_10100 [Gaiellaceae bacterium]